MSFTVRLSGYWTSSALEDPITVREVVRDRPRDLMGYSSLMLSATKVLNMDNRLDGSNIVTVVQLFNNELQVVQLCHLRYSLT